MIVGLSCDDSEVARDGGHEFVIDDILCTVPQGRNWRQTVVPPSDPSETIKPKAVAHFKNSKEVKDDLEFSEVDSQKRTMDLEVVTQLVVPDMPAPVDASVVTMETSVITDDVNVASTIVELADQVPIPDIHSLVSIDLQHVYGIRLADARKSVLYNEEGHVVYMAGTFGVINRRENQEQQQVLATINITN